MRGYLPFPTYTTPFIVTTWCSDLPGPVRCSWPRPVPASTPHLVPDDREWFLRRVGRRTGSAQVMFQASLWTGLLFLIGIALNDRQHAAWVLLGSVVGMLVASYHVDAAHASARPRERLIERGSVRQHPARSLRLQRDVGGRGPVSVAAVAVAPRCWASSLSVPLTEFVPMLGLPALTAPVCAGHLDGHDPRLAGTRRC